eukprot:6065880-Prymnesium_polylepis.1
MSGLAIAKPCRPAAAGAGSFGAALARTTSSRARSPSHIEGGPPGPPPAPPASSTRGPAPPSKVSAASSWRGQSAGWPL